MGISEVKKKKREKYNFLLRFWNMNDYIRKMTTMTMKLNDYKAGGCHLMSDFLCAFAARQKRQVKSTRKRLEENHKKWLGLLYLCLMFFWTNQPIKHVKTVITIMMIIDHALTNAHIQIPNMLFQEKRGSFQWSWNK